MEKLFRVSATSRVISVAGAIAKSIREGDSVVLQPVGAAAVNQAVKAVVIARRYLAADGLDIVFAPSLVDIEIDGVKRTALQFNIVLSGHPLPSIPAIPKPNRTASP